MKFFSIVHFCFFVFSKIVKQDSENGRSKNDRKIMCDRKIVGTGI